MRLHGRVQHTADPSRAGGTHPSRLRRCSKQATTWLERAKPSSSAVGWLLTRSQQLARRPWSAFGRRRLTPKTRFPAAKLVRYLGLFSNLYQAPKSRVYENFSSFSAYCDGQTQRQGQQSPIVYRRHQGRPGSGTAGIDDFARVVVRIVRASLFNGEGNNGFVVDMFHGFGDVGPFPGFRIVVKHIFL